MRRFENAMFQTELESTKRMKLRAERIEIAKSITFGKIKEVAEFDEGVLFNGRPWFQAPRKDTSLSRSRVTSRRGLNQ